jgi:hypothetical protein
MVTVTAVNQCGIAVSGTHTTLIESGGAPAPGFHAVYLPLVLRQWPPLAPTPPIHYLDDTSDQCPGHPVEIGHLYREDFGHANDNDWYSFQAVAGQYHTMQTSELMSRTDTVIYLYAPDCTTELVQNDDIHYPDNIASRIVWVAPSAGTYHVMVRSYDWRIYDQDTGYTFDIDLRQMSMEQGEVKKPSSLPTPGSATPTHTPTPTPTPTVTPTPTSTPEKPTPLPTDTPEPPPTEGGDLSGFTDGKRQRDTRWPKNSTPGGDTTHVDHRPAGLLLVTAGGRPGLAAPPSQATKPPAPPTPEPTKPPPPPTPEPTQPPPPPAPTRGASQPASQPTGEPASQPVLLPVTGSLDPVIWLLALMGIVLTVAGLYILSRSSARFK